MKGLLLKEWLLIRGQKGISLLIALVFFALSLLMQSTLFFLCAIIISASLPASLTASDERSRWTQYALAMPYSRSQIVSAKYLMSALLPMLVTALTVPGILLVFPTDMHGVSQAAPRGIMEFLSLAAGVGLLIPSLSLPAFFTAGSTKGRMIYGAVTGLICGAAFPFPISSSVYEMLPFRSLTPAGQFCAILASALAIMLLSWGLSCAVYSKRDL